MRRHNGPRHTAGVVLATLVVVSFGVAVDESVTAVVDRSLVTQIVQNLLSNAVKYNADDEPWVEVNCEDGAETLSVEVSNGGPGIPEEYQERLFGRFMRVDSARNRSVDGFGLGLNLSREFARAQGGELELIESAPGKTRFRLTLPKVV